MKYKVEKLPKSEILIEVTIPFSEFEPHLSSAAKVVSEEIKIEGFRKGKAPYAIVKERVGEMKIYERAAELAVQKTYPEVLTKLFAGGQAQLPQISIGKPEVIITKLVLGNDLEYRVKLALLPEVKLPDYKTIAARRPKEKKEVLVSEEEIKKAIEWLREARTTFSPVERPARKGDRAEIDFEARSGGVKIDPVRGKTPKASAVPLEAERTSNGVEQAQSKNHSLVLGQGKFVPGFEDQLLGMQKGEQKEFSLVMPEDWSEPSLSGKSLEFKVSMNSVAERRLPELTEEFAKSLGNFSSVEALTQNVRDGLQSEKKEKESQRVRMFIIEEIARVAEMEIPEILAERELDKMLIELKNGVEGMGMQWDDYLKHIKKTPEELKKEWREQAEKRVRIALCLREIAKKENIEPSEEEIQDRARHYLARFPDKEEAAKGIDPVRNSPPQRPSGRASAGVVSNGVDPQELHEYIKGVLRNEKVFEFLETS